MKHFLHPALTPAKFAIAAGYAAILAILWFQHDWILAPGGKPIASDFIAYRAAGLTALSGHAAAAYDVAAQHALQSSLAGPFPGYYYWNYPPQFFFVVAPLACLPFAAAFLLWLAATGAGLALAVKRIARRREAIILACASPAVAINACVGQGGLLTAALLGAGLAALPRRQILAGLFFGLLAYKPQFGILIPLALLAGGCWRAIFSACITVLITSAAAALVFGADSYAAFLHALSRTCLSLSAEGWPRMESLYSLVRFAGGSERAAWIVQGSTIFLCAGATFWLWRRNMPYALKAASLVVATMLSTPYLHEYDFPVLLIAFAFLYRESPFDHAEWIAVIAANFLMAAFIAQLAPIGPFIVMIAIAMIARRLVLLSRRQTASFEYDASHLPTALPLA